MARTEFRDRTGLLLGWREQSGSRIDGRDRSGRLVGWYRPDIDQTFDWTGWLIGRGDLLTALVVTRP